MRSTFLVPISEDQIRRERTRARDLRRSQWWKRRRASGICYYCGVQVGAHALTMDHKLPIIRGGRSTPGNIVPACRSCNDAKRHQLPYEWQPDPGGERSRDDG